MICIYVRNARPLTFSIIHPEGLSVLSSGFRPEFDSGGSDDVLMMFCTGNVRAGDLGLGAIPGREVDFRLGLDLALKYAKALKCKR